MINNVDSSESNSIKASDVPINDENSSCVVSNAKKGEVVEVDAEDCVVTKKQHNKTGSETIGDEMVMIGDAVNLQDAFAKFRQGKIRERKLRQACRGTTKGVRSKEFKDGLRERFVAQCRKYYGVPYHEKYRGDNPLQPLYLDCCGLIRQVMRDLAEDFGFIQGKWNQAYQFDTLPIELTFDQLRPGDLIFYEGTYTSPRSKVQKHDCVHVEVFVGGETGEATVGARFQKGVVQEFPSYLFPSTLWNLKKVHFRSIETWLDGNCQSCCTEHPWICNESILATAAGKRSIFNDDDDDESAGCPDDMGEIEGDNDEMEASLDNSVSFDAGAVNPLADDVGSVDSDVVMIANDSLTKDVALASCVSESPSTSAPATMPTNSTPTHVSTSTSGTKAADDSHLPLPSPLPSAEGEPMFMSPASKVTPARGPRLRVSKSLEMQKKLPRTYFVQKANGWRLVKAALDKRGWQQLPFEYNFSNRFGLKWVERRGHIDYKAHREGQLVCHIPNNDVVCTKSGLLTAFRAHFKSDYEYPWMMATYDLDIPADCKACCDAERADGGNGLWICKPASSNRGRGIYVLKGIDELTELCFPPKPAADDTAAPPSSPSASPSRKARIPSGAFSEPKGIVQKYIENPLLMTRRKFDIRCYLMISRNYPKYLAFYHPGYVRLTNKDYSTDDAFIKDNTVHLTNNAVQKKDDNYTTSKEFLIQTPQALAEAVEAEGNPSGAEYVRTRLDHDIKLCMVDVLKAGRPKMQRKHGYFDLLGLDFMITTDNKLILLECNTNPSLALSNSTLESMLPDVVDGAIELVLGAQGPDVTGMSGDEALKEALPKGYELIFDENTGFEYSSVEGEA